MKPHISLRSPTNYLSNVVSEPNTLRMSLWLPVVASHMCEMASYASSNKRKSAEMEDTSLTLFSSSFRRGTKVATHRCVVVCDTLREGWNSNYKASSDCDLAGSFTIFITQFSSSCNYFGRIPPSKSCYCFVTFQFLHVGHEWAATVCARWEFFRFLGCWEFFFWLAGIFSVTTN